MTIQQAVEYYGDIMNEKRCIKEIQRKIVAASQDPIKAREITKEDAGKIVEYLDAYYR